MSNEEYFTRMLALGYPQPSLSLWLDNNGIRKGSASHLGICGLGGESGAIYKYWGDLIKAVFDHITDGGKPYNINRS